MTQAIELGFLGEEDRHKVKSARSIPKHEYQYITGKINSRRADYITGGKTDE